MDSARRGPHCKEADVLILLHDDGQCAPLHVVVEVVVAQRHRRLVATYGRPDALAEAARMPRCHGRHVLLVSQVL
eukprot:8684737-Pyramimonas_sp.AAC.2